MQLKISIEQVDRSKKLSSIQVLNQDYVLVPGQKYIAGSDRGCSLPLPNLSDVSSSHIEFSFNSNNDKWHVKEISGKDNVLINGTALSQYRPVTQYPIDSRVWIKIGDEVSLVATPSDIKDQSSPNDGTPVVKTNPDILAHGSERARTQSIGSTATVIQTSTPTGNQGNQESDSIARSFDSLSWEDIGRPSVINLGSSWFKISTPEDGVGLKIGAFNLKHTYRVDHKENNIDEICQKLYVRVYQAVSEGLLGNAKVRPVVYVKDALKTRDHRRYILITRDTVYGNRTTIFVRFLEFGGYLYVGLDVYTLGNVSWLKVLKKLAITIALFLLTPFTLFLSLIAIPIIWWKLFWRMSYEKNVMLAIRQEFPGAIGGGPFDSDDVFMFSKSTVSLILPTVRKVFEEESLPLESLDAFIQQINNVTQINTEGGAISMIDSAIGTNNKLS